MLFHSSLRKELGRTFGATLVVLVTVVMTMMLIRTLGQASKGSVNPSEILMVMGYTVLGYLPTILALSLFAAIVSTLSRMYADSEMVIWFSAGRGLASFLRPLFRFAWPVLVVIALLALFVWPWSSRQIQDMKSRYEQRGDLDRIAPGQFQESAGGTRVYFIDKDTPDNRTGRNVFIASTEATKESVTSARSGHIETIGDDRFLVLQDGQRLESRIDRPEIRVSEFEQFANRIGVGLLAEQNIVPARLRSTRALLAEPTPPHLGELAWRIGLGLAAVNFVVLALALSNVNPRVSRSGNLIVALFAFVLYYNLLGIGQNWIAGGRVGFQTTLLALHGGTLALSLLWLAKRHNAWTLWPRGARRRLADGGGAA